MRQQSVLDGEWQFQLDPEGQFSQAPSAYDRTITVPLPWQAAFKDLAQYSGYAWYRREFDLAEDWLSGDLLLHFGAVDYWCQVFVNGELAGEHEGGYTPFTFSIKALARAGSNELAVRVYDVTESGLETPRWPNYPANPSHAKPPFGYNEMPHGKQEWYESVGGIWQSVTLTVTAARYLKNVHVTPHNSGEVNLKVELGGDLAAVPAGEIKLALFDQAGQPVGETSLAVVAGQASYSTGLTVQDPHLWEIGQSYLYTVKASLENGGAATDAISSRFGFREISTRDGKLLLNGRPFFLLGALDQDMYQDTIYTVPSREYLADQFRKAQELGLNCLRCHIKVPDPVYLELADEMGILTWCEIPSWRAFLHIQRGTYHPNQVIIDDILKHRVEQTLRDMVERDFNHPSLVIWTLVNEDWGTTLAVRQDDRDWVNTLYKLSKEIDPTRLVVDNSACGNGWGPNVHVHSDLEDFHNYNNIPDYATNFDTFVEALNQRPLWTYSTFGDTVRTGHEPLLLSEFGNWGIPSLKALQNPDGSDPYWFNMGPWWSGWGGEAGWPAGVQDRFTRYGLDKVWPDFEAFAAGSQWHQYNAMKYEIESMRRQSNFAGYVITELADIYWESNGLLDFKRQPKVYHDLFGEVNNPDVLMAKPERYNGWAGETVDFQLDASHYGPADWQGLQLTGNTAGLVVSQAVEVPQAAVTSLGQFKLDLPAAEKAQVAEYKLALTAKSGESVAATRFKLLTLPESYKQAAYQGQVAVLGNHGLGGHLQGLGYQAGTALGGETGLAITSKPTQELLDWVREGGDLLYLASSGPGPFFWVGGRGGPYSGDWVSSYTWLKPGIFRRLNGLENPLDMAFKEVAPRNIIQGLPFEVAEYHGDFLAGQVGGWVHFPVAHALQLRYGKGRVLMTTFALESALLEKSDTVATALLHDLVDYLKSPECNPRLSANY
ncbi:MAG: hypothetical protein J0I20_24850 [Chloroflexi bacterium]|nr:hypothetical protein [Chloroflexota bacterium]OJV99800.1 MAG: hypothetical protein BGO39_12730 [Chloroflexi bacterium 54-19]